MDRLPDDDPTLVEQFEQFIKTNAELYTLQFTDKMATIVSSLASRLVLWALVFIFMLISSMGIAFWIGQRIDAVASGFLIVAAGWLALIILLYLFRYALISKPVMNSIISQVLKKK